MSRSPGWWLVPLSLCLLSPTRLARAQSAEDRAAAEALFQAARELLSAGRVAEACEKFEASQRLDPAPGTQLNLASCYERAGRTASAWITFREAADTARRAGDARREREALDRARALEARLSKLTLEVPASLAALPGLTVSRDGKPLDRGAWALPVPVDPGRHRVEAQAPGFTPWSSEIDLSAGKDLVLALPPLAPLAAPSASASSPPTVPPPASAPEPPASASASTAALSGPSPYRTGALVAAGLGAVGLAAGAYFGLRASSRWSDAKGHCVQGRCDTQAESLSSEALRAGNASTVAFSIGGVLLAAGAVIWWVAPAPSAPSALAPRRLAPSVAVGRDGAAVVFGGAF